MLTVSRKNRSAQIFLFLLIGAVVGLVMSYAADMPNKVFFVIILGLAFPFATLLIQDLRRFLIVATILTLPIHFDINFMHVFERQAGAATAGISLTDIFLLGLFLIWIVELASEDRPYAVFFARLSIPAILYFEAAALSMLWAPRLDLAFMEVFRMFKVFLLYLILINHIRDKQDLRLAVWALMGTVAFEGLIAGMQIIKGGRLGLAFLGEAPPDPDGDSSMWRVMGTLGHPNKLATYIESLLLLSVGMFLVEKKKILRFVSLAIFSLGSVTLIMTGSRGAWIGFLLAFFVFIFFALRNKTINVRALFKPTLAALLILVVVGVAFSDMLQERIFGDDYGSAASRIPMIKIAINIISEHPVGGVGINNYQVNMREFNDAIESLRYTTIPRPVHNMYLLVAGETGFIGFFMMMLLLIALVRTLIQTAASKVPLLSVTSICILGGLCAFCVHGLVDKHPPGGYAPFYAMMAIAASAYLIDRRHHTSNT